MDDSSVSLIESKNTDTLGSAELSTVESHYEEQKEEQVGTVQEETTEKQYQKDNNEWYQSESALLEADNDDDIYIDQGFDAAVEYEQSQEPKPEHQRLDNDTSPKKGFQNFTDTDKINDLKVTGRIPDWLIGEYFTVGPGTWDIKYTRKVEIEGMLQNATATYTFGHWFDGLPLVNRFDLNGECNRVTYRNRSTSRRLVEKIRDHHGYAPLHPAGLYMSSTNQTVLTKFLKNATKASKPDAEPCSARILPNIPGLEGRLLVQNFANHVQELDPFDLKPIRVITWNEINPAFKGSSSCPNGQYDARTGEYINFSLDIGYQSVAYNFFSISDKNPKGSLIASVTAPMAYVNSFSITPRYIILAICPLLANSGSMNFHWCESIMDSFVFNPSEPTLFYVISRETGDVIATYRSDPCFAFHHVNAFEDDCGSIFVDMICYRDDTIARQLNIHTLRNPHLMEPSRLASSEVRRYRLNNVEDEKMNYLEHSRSIPSQTTISNRLSSLFGYFKGGKPPQQQRDVLEYGAGGDGKKWYSWMPIASFDKRVQPSLELPQVNPNYKLHKYNFMYGLGFAPSSVIQDGAIWDSIVKINMETKSVIGSWHREYCYPSEAVFIPKPGNNAEDDGVLACIVMDSSKSTSFLLFLDAITMTELATADIGYVVPLSFSHGSYRLGKE